LIVGKPDTGKSHVAKALAYQATVQGYDVRYLEADTEFARYALASSPDRATLLKEWVKPDLLIVDDLFLARRITAEAAEVLQAIVHQRYKMRRALVVTSNRVVQDWGKYLEDATMASTILDRLMHRCVMLEFEGKSYRLKEAAARLAINPETSSADNQTVQRNSNDTPGYRSDAPKAMVTPTATQPPALREDEE
jgi:DNA replication protein DnaC